MRESVGDPGRHEGSGDGALLHRLARGEPEACGVLYDRHGPLAYSLAYAITRSESRAEETVAKAFADLCRDAGALERDGRSIVPWLMNRVRGHALKSTGAASRTLEALQPAPAGAAGRGAGVTTAPSAFSELTASQRRSIELAYLAGRTAREIADELGEPVPSVLRHLRSAMDALRRTLTAEGPLTHDHAPMTRR